MDNLVGFYRVFDFFFWHSILLVDFFLWLFFKKSLTEYQVYQYNIVMYMCPWILCTNLYVEVVPFCLNERTIRTKLFEWFDIWTSVLSHTSVCTSILSSSMSLSETWNSRVSIFKSINKSVKFYDFHCYRYSYIVTEIKLCFSFWCIYYSFLGNSSIYFSIIV